MFRLKVKKVEGATVYIDGVKLSQFDYKEFIVLRLAEDISQEYAHILRDKINNFRLITKTKKKFLLLTKQIEICEFSK